MNHFRIVAGAPGGGKSKKIVEMLRTSSGRAVMLDGDHSPSQIRQLSFENRADIRHVANRDQLLEELERLVALDESINLFIDAPFLSQADFDILKEKSNSQMPITVTLPVELTGVAGQPFLTWPDDTYELIRVG
ncbi:MAG TPA: hypothetical protein DHD79_12305 [Firmicutes bacterium]|nr:hypothetical protein [Bacillota bacterium]HAW70673.1 hypothetical protein [Bacillota bacterium]HAZ21121.1 hypothetical protein [Bacillota bacterium]HBE06029.1 hypothetical protein [Bacillota bacterium]HBG42920.1 hypothetical protein [Bacillota bacterium]